MPFVEYMNKIYDPKTKEDDIHKTLTDFVEAYHNTLLQPKTFDVLFYVIRNSSKCHSQKTVDLCLDLIHAHRTTFFRFELFRLKSLGITCAMPMPVFRVYHDHFHLYALEINFLYTIEIQSRLWWLEELHASFNRYNVGKPKRETIGFHNVQLHENEYDYTRIVLRSAEKYGYL